MSERYMTIPEPGTAPAVEAGCTCLPADGEMIESETWPGWITRGCPVHGDKLAPMADGAPQQ